jgi:glycerol-3-phosphate acyltransferase PlsY
MITNLPVIQVLVISFFLGAAPFAYFTHYLFENTPLRRINNNKYPETKTYISASIFQTFLILLVEFAKGFFAIQIAFSIIGTSDYAFLISATFCLLGNYVASFLTKQKVLNTICLWGILFFLNPIVTTIILLMSLVALLLTKNTFIVTIGAFVVFILYYVFSFSLLQFDLLTYVIYLIISMFYVFAKNFEILLDFRRLKNRNIDFLLLSNNFWK